MAAKPESKEATKQIVCEPAIIKAPQMSSWNDNRLDRLEHRMDEGFKEVKGEIKEVRQEMHAGFEKVDQEFKAVRQEMGDGFEKVEGEVKEGFKEVNQRFDRLTNVLIAGGIVLIAALVGVIGSILVAVVFA
jgi:uncharacterized protein YjbJ (UPF0337 family)